MSRSDIAKRLAELPPEQRARLFEELQKQKAAATAAADDRMPVIDREMEVKPLSFAQQRLWFLNQYDSETPEYNIPQGFHIRGALDRDALERAFNAILERHEVLRTTFEAYEGEPMQIIGEELRLELPLVDLGDEPAEERQAKALEAAGEDARKPFDLEKGPLLRAILYRLGAEDHLLYVNAHHVVWDDWSQGVFLSELRALYEDLSAGREPGLEPLAVQYLDFAVWQRDWLSGDKLKGELDYWRQRLQSVPPLELPFDRPRPAVKTPHGAIRGLRVAPDVTGALQALAQEARATLFMVVSAAFKTLLSHYSGQTDFAVGTLIANRTRPEVEGMLGFFANTLALRTDLSGNPTFRELLEREREVTLGAYSHQDLPFEKLVDELQPERELSRTPLFQVMLILHNAPGKSHGLPDGLQMAPVSVDSKTAKFDLTLYLIERDGGMTGFFEYNTDLFDRPTIDRIAAHFDTLLHAVAARPDGPIADLPLLTDAERERVLVEWNATAAELPTEPTLPALFAAQVAARGEETALVFGDEEMSYGELSRRAAALARYLRGAGVRSETLVGVFTERSLEMMVGLLGVLKAGGAYVPLDPEYPEDRIAYMLEDSRAPVVLTQKDLLEKLPDKGARPIRLDADWGEIEKADGDTPLPTPDAEQRAYVIYTSGSTGKPKGVQIPHRALVNFLCSMAKKPGLTAEDRLLAVTTLSFDIAGLELYLPLVQGATVELASREVTTAGEELKDRLEASPTSVMQATPATWRLLIDSEWKGDEALKILCGGEALPRELADQILERCGELWNVYGPTEATIWSTLDRVAEGNSISIGRPMDNTQVYLLNRRYEPVPIGAAGELMIGGLGLARGYLERPGLTAERFIPHPFAPTPGQRLYRTGDLARFRTDGRLDFLGRIDHQVKVRGFRIELGEIEAALGDLDEIKQAVVMAREDTPGQKRLVAYVIYAVKEPPKLGELKAKLKERLPDYMVPALVVPVDEMPLTPNGKVDRRALPVPDASVLADAIEYVPPANANEKTLVDIWSEILGLGRVSVEGDFFDLGGDSLMVVRVVAKAKKAGLPLTTKQVFEHRTIRKLAAASGTVTILAEQGPVFGELPMTPAQHHFLGLGHPRPELHSLGFLMAAKEGADPRSVEAAVATLLEHHDTLRVRLATADPPSLMVDEPGAAPWLHFVDFSSLPADEMPPMVGKTVFALNERFDLAGGPLLKTVIFDFGDVQPRFVFLLGHFMGADVGSYQILLEDYDTAYQLALKGQTPKLTEKTTAARDWASRLIDRANSKEFAEEIGYWTDEARYKAKPLPLDFDQGANTFNSARTIRVLLSKEETDALLRDLPRRHGAQIDAIVCTSFLYAFEPWTGQRCLMIDLLGHGREAIWDDLDLTRTVGWFNTIYPAFVDLGEAADPLAALPKVNQQLRDIPQGGIGYGLTKYLNRDAGVAAKVKALPPSSIFFNYFGPDTFEISKFEKVDFFGGYAQDGESKRLCPLTIGGYIEDGRLLFKWEYSNNLHEHDTIEEVARRSEQVLKDLVVASAASIKNKK